MARATSSGPATRSSGTRRIVSSRAASGSSAMDSSWSIIGVSTGPGATALTRTVGASSTASPRVSPTRPALAAL